MDITTRHFITEQGIIACSQHVGGGDYRRQMTAREKFYAPKTIINNDLVLICHTCSAQHVKELVK